MPIYLPWITVLTALLTVVGILSAIDTCALLISLYVVSLIIVFTLSFLGLVKLSKSLLLLCSVPILSFLYATYRLPVASSNNLSNYLNQKVIFTASIVDLPKLLYSTRTANISTMQVHSLTLLFPEQKSLDGHAQIVISAFKQNNLSTYFDGQLVHIEGKVTSIDRSQAPWLSGLINKTKRNGIFCQIHTCAAKIKTLPKKNDLSARTSEINTFAKNIAVSIIDQLRKNITNTHLCCLGEKAGSLLASMVLGDRAATLDAQLLNTFRKLGLSHVVAASGFNLTIVTMLSYWFLRKISLSRKMVTAIVITNVIFYAALAGLSASIVRAAITCILVLIVHFHYRRLHSMAALSLVLMINLIIDPRVVMEPGAQLSYTAVAGIIFGANTLADAFSLGSKNKAATLSAAAVSVVLIAQISVLPIQLYHFWQAGLLFLPANLLIDPLVAPVTIIGFIASLFSLINLPFMPFGIFICQCLDWLAAIPLQIIISISEKLATSDLSLINTGQPAPVAIIVYYLSLISCLIFLPVKRLRSLGIVLFCASFCVLFYQPELKQAVIIILPSSTITINRQRQAICFGERDSKTNKILAYYATSLFDYPKIASDKDRPIPPFQLWSKQNSILLEAPKDHFGNQYMQYFYLSTQMGSHASIKKYLICRHKIDAQHPIPLSQNDLNQLYPLSLSRLKEELPNIDWQISPFSTVDFYLISH